MRALAWITALALGAIAPAAMAQDSCGTPVNACEIDGGSYHIARPPDAVGTVPALMFLHGFGSQGRSTMNNGRIVQEAHQRGYAVIAPNGSEWREGRLSWNFRLSEDRRDDVAFLQNVLADAADRFDIAASDSVLGGFSVGGSMVAYVACQAPDSFAAFVPVAGNFWRPHPAPQDCAGPVRMLHTHGWRDGTVPLEGRVLRAGAFHQGDVFYALQIWRDVNGCTQTKADRMEWGETFKHRAWNTCLPGSYLEFALFDGGHTVPGGWAPMMFDWLDAISNES